MQQCSRSAEGHVEDRSASTHPLKCPPIHPSAASVQADCQAVDGWPALAPALPADVADPAAAASPLGPAFARLHREQTHQWQAADARRQQLEALRAEVAAARAAAASANGSGSSSAPDSTQHQELAAQQAGLRAELECLERAQRAAGKAAAASSQRAAEVQAARDSVAALEAREQALDAAVRALCCADSQVMRQWRQDVWRAQEAVEMGVLAQRQPLAALGQRLAEAQRQELAAFRRAAAQQPAGSVVGGSASARSSVLAAAQLLDPLAGLKTETAAEGVMAAAAAELRELQPAAVQWAGLAEAAAGRLAALQSVAAELQGKVGALRDEGGSSALAQLREAAAAAEEGSAAVGRARQALSEWWTSPAITATPWVKRELLGRCCQGGCGGGMRRASPALSRRCWLVAHRQRAAPPPHPTACRRRGAQRGGVAAPAGRPAARGAAAPPGAGRQQPAPGARGGQLSSPSCCCVYQPDAVILQAGELRERERLSVPCAAAPHWRRTRERRVLSGRTPVIPRFYWYNW